MRVALVKLSSLGDIVHALPVAAALRRGLPQARLTWIVERREAAILHGNAAIDEVVPVDTRGWRRALDLRALWRPLGAVQVGGAINELVRHLRAARFDVALDLQGLLKSGVLTAMTGAPLRIGFAARHCREPVNALFTNRRVTPPPDARHVVEQYLALLAPLGVRAGPVTFPLPAHARAEAGMDDFLAAAGLKPARRLVLLNPGAGRADKRWPVERFRALAARLVEEAAASVLVVWGPDEHSAARDIAGGPAPGVRLAPPTNLEELLALLRRASVVVAGDTGPVHLAAALGTACVGLYGPTPAERNGPWGQVGRALQSPTGALEGIAVDAVFHAVTEALEP